MGLHQELLKKVPSHIREEPHFPALLEHIKKHGIQDKEHLMRFLQQEIALVESWMKEHSRAGGTAVKTLRDKTVQLDVLKKCFNLAQKFLL